MKTRVLFGQPSWIFSSDRVEAAITRQGGHLGPVKFCFGRKEIAPFSVAPWAEEKQKLDPLLQSLRGDFFCAPFGGSSSAWRAERHPPHGETANSPWTFQSLKKQKGMTELHLSLATKIRPGKVDKFLQLRDGHTAVYCRHVLSGMSGPMNLGHHATLKFPAAVGSGVISTSSLRFGQVYPKQFEDPAKGGYSSLKPGATFSRLDRVPAMNGSYEDVSRYPARRGFEDLLMMVHEARKDFAWTAVTFPGERYVWFALKDPRVLRSTVLWISNGGRHYAPWNGRHTNVMGLEDVTSYFHEGLASSAKTNGIDQRGIPTVLQLSKTKPLTVNYIMAMAAVPKGFSRVDNILTGTGDVTLVSSTSQRVKVPIDLPFLYEQSR
jgi:hypothetical protein